MSRWPLRTQRFQATTGLSCLGADQKYALTGADTLFEFEVCSGGACSLCPAAELKFVLGKILTYESKLSIVQIDETCQQLISYLLE